MVNRCQSYFDRLGRSDVGGTFKAISTCDHCHLPIAETDSFSIVNGVVSCSACCRCRCGRVFGPGGPFRLRGQHVCRYCVLDDLNGKIAVARHDTEYRRWRRSIARFAVAWTVFWLAFLVWWAVQ